MALRPQVLSSTPKNYQTNVAVNTGIQAEFNVDLDNRYLNPYVRLTDTYGNIVEGRVVYKQKIVSFVPTAPLSAGVTYTLTLIGDSDVSNDKSEGIRNIIGESMLGNISVSFTTETDGTLAPPIGLKPTSEAVINTAPSFEWKAVDEATGYQLEISRSNRFDILLFPINENIIVHETALSPQVTWEDGIHYWRIRTEKDGKFGEWSSTYQFNLDRLEEGTISEEDSEPLDVFIDEAEMELELIEQFPGDLAINVPSNIKSLYFRMIGDVDSSSLDSDAFTLKGVHITGDEYEESHGDVTGSLSVVKDEVGTVYVIFTPDEIGGEE